MILLRSLNRMASLLHVLTYFHINLRGGLRISACRQLAILSLAALNINAIYILAITIAPAIATSAKLTPGFSKIDSQLKVPSLVGRLHTFLRHI